MTASSSMAFSSISRGMPAGFVFTLYSNGGDKLIQATLSALTERLVRMNLCVVTAESCTGGLLASLLTTPPGSSQWFERGFVTYSNQSKQEMLGVDGSLIERMGAVSMPVAEAMALGALNHSLADVAVSITGIAGPSGGSPDKPVGTVFFAFARRSGPVHTHAALFQSISRQQIREDACLTALQGMNSLLTVG